MSIVPEAENMLVALREQEPEGKNALPILQSKEIDFQWKLVVRIQGLPSGKWQVQLTFKSDGSISRSFESDPLDMVLNEPATIKFPIAGGTDLPDDFWVDRFESSSGVHNNNRNKNSVILPPEIRVRLLPDSGGTQPKYLAIEETSMTIFWIIGARNIILTEHD